MNERNTYSKLRQALTSERALVDLLFGTLDWPLSGGIDDASQIPLLGWLPEELNLDPNQIAKLQNIKQLPKLSADQPFGIFFLSFSGGRLPLGAIKRVLGKLVKRQRSVSNQNLPTWEQQHLMFFCHIDGDSPAVHVVSFREESGKSVAKAISWDSTSTDERLGWIFANELSHLRWPDATSQRVCRAASRFPAMKSSKH